MQAIQVGRLRGNGFQGIITGSHKLWTQVQIFRAIARQRQLRREQQVAALGVRILRGLYDALGIAREIADYEIELSN